MTLGAEPRAPAEPTEAQVERDIERQVVRGSAWIGLSHGGHTVLWMITLFVLARILDPADFGITSIAGTILIVVGHLQQGGVSSALVQRRTDARVAAASALVFSIAIGAVAYAVIFAAAPLAASFFHSARLDDVIRVLAIALAIRSVTWVGVGILERRLAFARAATGELAGAVAEMGLAIGFAVGGAGVWSIVFGQLGGAVVEGAVTWTLVRNRPSLRHFSLPVLLDLLRFGRYVSAGGLLVLFSATVDNLFVGRILGAHSLGFYALAYRLAAIPGAILGVVAERVTLPAYSLLQDNRAGFGRSYLANLQRLSLLALPLGVGLIVAANPIVEGLLGDRWAPAIGPLRVLAVYGVLESLAGTTSSVFQAANRPHLLPLTALVGLVTLIPMLYVLTSRHGTVGTAFAMLIGLTPVAGLRIVLACRIVGVRAGELARTLAPPVACAALLGLALLGLTAATADLGAAPALAVLISGGLVCYVLAASVLARGAVAPIVAGFRRTT